MIFAICRAARSADAAVLRAAARQAAVFAPGGEAYSGDGVFMAAGGPLAAVCADPDAGAAAAFDGELYNAPALRAELAALGAKFRTQGDAELVLRAFLAWGPACQLKLNGAWAFAVWDARRRELFCSRDRFGGRPLYRHSGAGHFSCCSSLRALLSCPHTDTAPDPAAVFGYLALLPPEDPEATFFAAARQLAPGCCLTAGPGASAAAVRYYEPVYNPEAGRYDPRAAAGYAERLRALLEQAVADRCGAPGPACSMSGGLDSASVACLAARRGPLKVFSLAYDNEAARINRIAAALKLDLVRISPGALAGISWDGLTEAALHGEEPRVEPSFLGVALIFRRAAAAGERVLLGGMGADELLAGHRDRYFEVYLSQVAAAGDEARFRREAGLLCPGRLDIGGPGACRAYLRSRLCGRPDQGRPPLAALDGDFYAAHARRLGAARRPELNLQRLLRRELLGVSNAYAASEALWSRQPFLDHGLADFVLSLPACYQLHAGRGKHLLREAMRGDLPDEIVDGLEKLPTPTGPYKKILRRERPRLRALLAGGRYSRAFVDRRAASAAFDGLFAEAVAPGTDNCSLLWRLANLELWLGENARLFGGSRRAAAEKIGGAFASALNRPRRAAKGKAA